MASFDIIDATNKGYSFFWKQRVLIAKLAFFPVFIKFISLLVIAHYGWEQNFLRSGLVMIPAYFIEGWLLANLLRAAFFSDLGIPQLSGNPENDEKIIKQRGKDMMAGTIVYVLIKLSGALLLGLVGVQNAMMSAEDAQARTQEPNALAFIAALLILVGFVWTFRIMFLYIPIAMGYSVKYYMHRLKGMMSSLYLLGAWLMCFLPILFLTILGFDFISTVLGEDPENFSTIFYFFGLGWRAIMETTAEIISTIAIGYGVLVMLDTTGKAKKQNDRGSQE